MKTLKVLFASFLVLAISAMLTGVAGAQTVVYPTGVATIDVQAVQDAVDAGGTVILKAQNTSGQYTAFNFGDSGVRIGSSSEELSVTILGEKLSGAPMGNEWDPDPNKPYNVSFYDSTGTNVLTYSDRAVIYEGGKYAGSNSIVPFTVLNSDDVVINQLRFEEPFLAAISAVGMLGSKCKKAECKDNVIANVRAFYYRYQYGFWWETLPEPEITLENNMIMGQIYRGMELVYVKNGIIRNNTIDRPISPTNQPWHNCAIGVDDCTNCTVQGNTILGEGRCAIHLHGTQDSYIIDNDCSGYTAKWVGTIPPDAVGLCQLYFAKHSDGNIVTGNTWGHVPTDGAAVVLASARAGASSNLSILNNDYRQAGVPGWTTSDGPGCVLLANGTENSLVDEVGSFPKFPGQSNAQTQIVDLTKELTGSTTNRVVGHPQNFFVGDENPGIGQRLQAIMDQLDALPYEEEPLP